GTISPAANTWIWNLFSVASPTILANTSAPPCSVSSDFGKLVVNRHFNSGIDCAMAGAATAVDTATPAPAARKNSRRLIMFSSALDRLIRPDQRGRPTSDQGLILGEVLAA